MAPVKVMDVGGARSSYSVERARSRLLNLLQIAAILLVVGVHAGVRATQWAQVTVELFFVVAGLNMTRYIGRYQGVIPFVAGRAKRMYPELAVVWCITLVLFVFGLRTQGVVMFLAATPVFLENFVEPYFQMIPGVDWVFLLALWFVGALFQLQVILFLCRKVFVNASRSRVIGIVVGAMASGLAFRAMVATLTGGLVKNLDQTSADTIYRMPLSHIEPIVLGFLLGLGVLPRIGKWFPIVGGVTLAAGITNYLFGRGVMRIDSLGFPVCMPYHFQYLWGYPLFALLAVSMCAPDSVVARTVERLKLPAWMDAWASQLGRLTYGVYVFHGMFLAVIERQIWVSGIRYRWYLHIAVFLVVSGLAFGGAWLLQIARERPFRRQAAKVGTAPSPVH